MTRSPAELEPEIEASRQALARDVAALKARATPRRLMGDAVETARHQGRRAGRRLLEVASSDTVLASVIGGGLLAGVAVWLLVSRRRAAREDTAAARVARAAEPIGAILAGATAWMLARRRRLARKVARQGAVAAIVARAAEPIGPLWRRVSPRKRGVRALLPF